MEPGTLERSRPRWGRAEWALCGIGLALYLVVARPFLGRFADDAYISLRYAQNWAAGCGVRYNCGEPAVEGYTNFLWTAVAAGAIRLGIDPVPLLRWLGLLAGFAGLALAAMIARRLHEGRLVALVPLVGFAASPFWAVNAVSGLETAAAGACVAGAAYLSLELPERRGPWLAGIAWGGAYLLRPEALLFALVTGIHSALRGLVRGAGVRRTCVGTALFAAGFVAIAAPYFLWRVRTYGALFPNTYAAKRLPLEWVLGPNLRVLSEHLLFFSVLGGGALVVVATARRRLEALYLLALALAGAAVSLSVQNNAWMPGHRLYMISSLLLAALAAGAAGLGVRATGWRAMVGPAAAVALTGLLLVAAVRGFPGTLALARESYALDDAPARELGRRIARTARPGEWLAIRDAGMVPYHAGTRVKVLDTHERSLNDRIIVRDGWDIHYVLARDLRFIVLISFSPDVFVLAHPVEEAFLTPDFEARYRLVTSVPWHPRRHFFLYERVPR